MNSTVKVHQYLAHAGISSRRKAEQLILDGRIKVNGQPAHVGQRIDPQKDTVFFDDTKVNTSQDLVFYKMYKPRGFVSTLQDELGRKTVVDLLPEIQERVYPVGRLDLESEGLLIMTNDGELTQILTHPKFEVEKTYHVLLQGIPSTPALQHLKRGVKLKEGYTKPVKMKILSRENQQNTWLELSIKEGRNQQVRRMIRRIGYEVLRLKRVQFGPVSLDSLAPGDVQSLSQQEIDQLTKMKSNLS